MHPTYVHKPHSHHKSRSEITIKPNYRLRIISLIMFMFKKITALTIIGGLLISSGTFAYTATDVETANYLANQGIIKNWSSSPETYHLDSYMARAGVIGMVANMTGVTINANCRGDFSDVRSSTVNDEYICRIIETAADNNFINAQRSLPTSMRKVRPYERVTHSEAVGILMK